MVKPKQRHQLPVNSGSAQETDGEHDWVIVKKQKVTILIPPLPVTKKSAMPNPKQNQLQDKLGNSVNVQSPPLIKPNFWRHSDTNGEKSVSITREKTIPDFEKPFASQTISPAPCPLKPDTLQPRIGSKFPVVQYSGYKRAVGVRSASKLKRKTKSFRDGNLRLHQSLRASNLERKLRRAGGLSRWLTSLGLDQFVTFFESRRVSKFQLVNLTMKKLKDMGVAAVGPRRKLMHSIDCLCQPHCFVAL
ncbi:hypothetical protein DCAR_0417569 [Daucus carota subsp. sativus]|uniref:SAM domain-containing protein n=1 Tax=Daucus carota subsp. sativus TaxID=79200 RepID=A0A162ACF5_DAUCS|nr:PREDICTED: uncharacterized protein LOC108218460 [Daucus carota subsp. sativus]WOG98228.1 hypothetical protein DCAR_0417569 [Daucus carota subsp. sativus]